VKTRCRVRFVTLSRFRFSSHFGCFFHFNGFSRILDGFSRIPFDIAPKPKSFTNDATSRLKLLLVYFIHCGNIFLNSNLYDWKAFSTLQMNVWFQIQGFLNFVFLSIFIQALICSWYQRSYSACEESESCICFALTREEFPTNVCHIFNQIFFSYGARA